MDEDTAPKELEPHQVRRIAQNVIKTYGRQKFLQLIEMLRAGIPGPVIAKEFNVTRQRINQWKMQLGKETINYTVHPAIEDFLETNTRKTV